MAQKGNKNAAHDKPWAAAVRRALLAEDGKKLRAIAEKVVAKAVEGDMPAIKEIGERLDGKAIQPVAAEVDMNVTVEIVKFASQAA
jgi:hypothetical protein